MCLCYISSLSFFLACGSAKASLTSKRSTIISNGDLNIDVSALSGGVKRRRRSMPEEHDDDCDNAKKSIVEIKQAAVSAIPGKNEDSSPLVTGSERNEKKSNVKDSHDYLMLPGKESTSNTDLERKDKLEKPNKKHSPLWSLSKLIENVDTKGSKKTTVIVRPSKLERAASKSNLATATDPANAIKATLSKAIEKVEKVIAVKNAKQITPVKAIVRSPSSSSGSSDKEQHQSTVTGQTKSGSTTTNNEKSSSSASTQSGTAKAAPSAPAPAPVKAKVQDPYAEIAAGPDRPKIPELKSDAGDASPVMKMQGGEMKPVNSLSADPAARNAKPLAGEHDVGGLLDRLTDKLNSGGLFFNRKY